MKKRAMKKAKSMVFVCSMVFSLFWGVVVQASNSTEKESDTNEVVLSEHMYDGIMEQELGEFIVSDNTGVRPADTYHEYDKYVVTNQGITKQWSWLSKPYFITSIARGTTKTRVETVTATISGSISGSYPAGAKSGICKKAGLSSAMKKTVTKKITMTGPPSSSEYTSRDFYYKHGRHTYKFKVVREHRNNWDGLMWKKTYYVNVGIPAIKNYSQDTK